MENREEFEKVMQDYAEKHLTGSTALVRKIAAHFYDSRQPEIDGRNEVIDQLALQKGLLKAEIGRLKDEIAGLIHDNGNMLKAIAEYDRENAALKAEVEPLRKDSERFRWLCEDHDSKEVRERRDRILEHFSVRSYSASCINIDTAMKEITHENKRCHYPR